MVAEHGISVLWGDVPNGSLPRVGSPQEREELLRRYAHAAVGLELQLCERDKDTTIRVKYDSDGFSDSAVEDTDEADDSPINDEEEVEYNFGG